MNVVYDIEYKILYKRFEIRSKKRKKASYIFFFHGRARIDIDNLDTILFSFS